jgi:hypothetical protein
MAISVAKSYGAFYYFQIYSMHIFLHCKYDIKCQYSDVLGSCRLAQHVLGLFLQLILGQGHPWQTLTHQWATYT